MSEIVIYSQEGATATVKLNRPDSLNAFNTELRRDLLEALNRAEADNSVRVVILTGEGRSFCAGADLKDGIGPSVSEMLLNEYRPVQEKIATMPKPVIAVVPGSAAGIGLSIALQCDLLIMADDAFMLSPFTTISLIPDGGLNWLLVRQLGYRRAFQLSVESERVAAERCVELGLANRAVPAQELQEAASQWAQTLAKRAPLSVAGTKKLMRFASENDWASSFEREAQLQGKLYGNEDNEEGVAAFFEKRAPDFKGK
ncbi:MAG: enoyl-CoA hydratase/isomerase family protein [Woeseiaceae bacterium]